MLIAKFTKAQIKQLINLIDKTIWNLEDRIKFAPTTRDASYHIGQRDSLKTIEEKLRKVAQIYDN